MIEKLNLTKGIYVYDYVYKIKVPLFNFEVLVVLATDMEQAVFSMLKDCDVDVSSFVGFSTTEENDISDKIMNTVFVRLEAGVNLKKTLLHELVHTAQQLARISGVYHKKTVDELTALIIESLYDAHEYIIADVSTYKN